MSSSVVPLQAIPVSSSNRVVVTGPCILLKTTTVAQQVRALRPIKKQEPTDVMSSEPEFLRCKRRADFSKLGLNMPKVHPVASSRRNARERNRVKQVNNGFDTLRQRVPNGKKNKKMSKVDTLRAAVEYIKNLQELLDQSNCSSISCGVINDNENSFSTGIPTVPQSSSIQAPSFSSSSSPSSSSSTCSSTSLSSSSSLASSSMLAPSSQSCRVIVPNANTLIPTDIIHSPGPSECSDSCESSVSSFEDRDFSEFSTWIDALCGVNLS